MESKILQELSDLINQDKLAIFVGAGVSKNSDFPSWNDLTNKISEKIKLRKKKYYTFEEHTQRAQYLYNEDEETYQAILKNVFDVERSASDLHKKIMDLNQSTVVTTNYDNLLEISGSGTIHQYGIIKNDKDLLTKTNKKKQIIKMHGDIKDIDTVVLKEDDYLNYKRNKKAIHTYLSHLFFTKSILFIGYGLGDYNVKQLLKDIQQYHDELSGEECADKMRHFFLTCKDSKNKKEYNYNKKLIEKQGVKVIEVDEYINREVNTSLSGMGKGLYAFLNTVENLELSNREDKFEIIENRLEKLMHNEFISTDELINIFEIKGNAKIQSTQSTLYISSSEVYNYIRKKYNGKCSNVSSVFSKTLLKDIVHLQQFDEEGSKFEVENYKQRLAFFVEKLLAMKLENIFIDCMKDSFFRTELSVVDYEKIRLCFEQKNTTNNEYNLYRNQLNEILLEDTMHQKKKMPDKIGLVENALSDNEKKAYNYMLQIAKYQFQKDKIYKYTLKLEEESQRKSGLYFTNENIFELLNRYAQGMYLYPMLNGIATQWYNSEFFVVGRQYAGAYLSLFGENFQNRELQSQFKQINLDIFDILMISEFIKSDVLQKTIVKFSVKKIRVDFVPNILIEFLEKYVDALVEQKRRDNRILIRDNKFITNLLVFIGLADVKEKKGINRKIEAIFSKSEETFDYLLFYYNLEFVESTINQQNYNKVLKKAIDDDKFFYDNGKILFESNVEVTDEIRQLFNKKIPGLVEKNEIPMWFLKFGKTLPYKELLGDLNRLSFNSLLSLVLNDFYKLDNYMIDLICTKINIANIQGVYFDDTKYFYNGLVKLNNIDADIKNIWKLFEDFFRKTTENFYVTNVIKMGSLVKLSSEILIGEAKLILSFLRDEDLSRNIDMNKIKNEIIDLEKSGLDSPGANILWGGIFALENQNEN